MLFFNVSWKIKVVNKTFLTYRCIHLNYFISISDDDLPGAHLLAEAKFSLQKIFPQMQKKFQISLERPNLRVSEDKICFKAIHDKVSN